MEHYALITGATSGIGECMAYELAKDKYSLLLVGRSEKKLKNLQDDIQKTYNVEVMTYQVDLTKRDEVHQLIQDLEKQHIKLQVFVNNAGIGHYGTFLDCPVESDMETIEVNIVAFTYLTKMLYPYLEKDAMVLQVASTAAFAPGPYMAVYYASKAYVLSLSLALRKEWKPRGIHVSVLCPGPTKTAFQERAHMEKSELAKSLAMTAKEVAEIAMKGMKKHKALIIPGMTNKIAARTMEFLPSTLGAILVSKTQKK